MSNERGNLREKLAQEK